MKSDTGLPSYLGDMPRHMGFVPRIVFPVVIMGTIAAVATSTRDVPKPTVNTLDGVVLEVDGTKTEEGTFYGFTMSTEQGIIRVTGEGGHCPDYLRNLLSEDGTISLDVGPNFDFSAMKLTTDCRNIIEINGVPSTYASTFPKK